MPVATFSFFQGETRLALLLPPEMRESNGREFWVGAMSFATGKLVGKEYAPLTNSSPRLFLSWNRPINMSAALFHLASPSQLL